MLRLMCAVVLLWALTTSGLTAGDVVSAVGAWAADHVEISVSADQPQRGRQFSQQRQDSVIDLGPFSIRTNP